MNENLCSIIQLLFLSVLLAPLKNPLCQNSMNGLQIRNFSFTSQMKGGCYHIKGLLLKLNLYLCNICCVPETTSRGHFIRVVYNTFTKLAKLLKVPRAMSKFGKPLDFSYLFFFHLDICQRLLCLILYLYCITPNPQIQLLIWI